jgi:hypothetical protein
MDATPPKTYVSCAMDRRFTCADTPSSTQSTSTEVGMDPISPDDSVSVVNAPIRRVADDRGRQRRRHEARIAQIEFCKKSLTTRAKNRKDRVDSLRRAEQQHHENYYLTKHILQKEEKLLKGNEAKIRSYEADLLGLNAQLVAEADDYPPLPLMDGGLSP